MFIYYRTLLYIIGLVRREKRVSKGKVRVDKGLKLFFLRYYVKGKYFGLFIHYRILLYIAGIWVQYSKLHSII